MKILPDIQRTFQPSAGLSYWKIGTRQMCMKWLLIIRHVNSVEQCRTVSTVSTMSTVSTVSTVIARCYLHLRWYFVYLWGKYEYRWVALNSFFGIWLCVFDIWEHICGILCICEANMSTGELPSMDWRAGGADLRQGSTSGTSQQDISIWGLNYLPFETCMLLQ